MGSDPNVVLEILDYIFVKPCDICNVLIGVRSHSKQITDISQESFRDSVSGCLERNILTLGSTTLRTS